MIQKNSKEGDQTLEVLKLKPVKGKQMSVILINLDSGPNASAIDLTTLLRKVHADISTIDIDKIYLDSPGKAIIFNFFNLFREKFVPLSLPQHVKDHLIAEILEMDEQVNELLDEFEKIKDKISFKAHNLKCWVDMLIKEVKEKKKNIDNEVRLLWIAKKILEVGKIINKKKVTIAHFTQQSDFANIKMILETLNVTVNIYNENDMLAKWSNKQEVVNQCRC